MLLDILSVQIQLSSDLYKGLHQYLLGKFVLLLLLCVSSIKSSNAAAYFFQRTRRQN